MNVIVAKIDPTPELPMVKSGGYPDGVLSEIYM